MPSHIYLCRCPMCSKEWMEDVPPHHVRHEDEQPRCPRCDRLTTEDDRETRSVEEMREHA